MDLADLLTSDRIRIDIEARSKKRALELVAEALSSAHADLGQAAVFSSLLGRERLGSTAIGHGVALPHGRVEGITGCIGALVRLRDPVDFEAEDGVPVDLVFGLLVPTVCGDEHLAALAAVARCFDRAELRQALRDAPDLGGILDLFKAAACG